jgi:hypothetical protein
MGLSATPIRVQSALFRDIPRPALARNARIDSSVHFYTRVRVALSALGRASFSACHRYPRFGALDGEVRPFTLVRANPSISLSGIAGIV